jgi:hypothetical protein
VFGLTGVVESRCWRVVELVRMGWGLVLPRTLSLFSPLLYSTLDGFDLTTVHKRASVLVIVLLCGKSLMLCPNTTQRPKY